MSKTIFGPSGGVGGHPFDDTPPYENAVISEVRIWSGACIEALQLVLDIDGEDIEYSKHGGRGGNLSIIKLAQNEYITEVYGRYGSYVDSLCIRTSQGQIRRFGGQGGHSEFIYTAPQGYNIIGFWGRAGNIVDALGIHICPLSYSHDWNMNPDK